MPIWKRFFGGEREVPQSGSSVGKSRDLAKTNCWAASLWWAAKALDDRPNDREARKLFQTAFANTYAQLAFKASSLQKQLPRINELFRARSERDLTDEEADRAAEALGSSYYVAFATQQV